MAKTSYFFHSLMNRAKALESRFLDLCEEIEHGERTYEEHRRLTNRIYRLQKRLERMGREKVVNDMLRKLTPQ